MRNPMTVLVLVVAVAGCYSWQTVDVTRVATDPLPERLRITNVLGERFELFAPMVNGDSLTGRRSDIVVMVPFSALARVEAHRFSWWRTGFLVGTPVAIVGLGVAACANGGCSPGTMSW